MTYEEREERFHIYRLKGGGLEIVATCTDPESVGVALVTLHCEGEFDGAKVGVLDRPSSLQTGTWIVSPWGNRASE